MTATIGELCAGYGGLGMGVSRVIDAEVAWYSEIDKGALKVLEHRFPGVPNIGDMTTTDWHRIPWVDILCAGYPCQPFSHAGNRKGTNDDRHLWPHVREAIRHLRPNLTILENVAGHRSLGFDRVLGDLAEDGMRVVWTSVRASDVGAPHRRERLFIGVAPDDDLEGLSSLGWIYPERRDAGENGSGSTGEPSTLLPTPVADHSRGLPSPTTDYQSLPNVVCSLLPTPAVNDMGAAYTPETWDAWTDRMKAEHSNGNGHGKSLNIEAQRLLPTPSVADGLGGHLSRSGDRSSELLLPGVAKEITNASATEAGPREAMRDMREAVNPQEVREREARGSDGVPKAEELLTGLREQSGDGDSLSARLPSEAVPQGDLRGVRDSRTPARTSPRPELGERRPNEPRDPVCLMPSQTPLAGGSRGPCGCGTSWGEYEAAIRRWEGVLGRCAPPPTMLSTKGTPQLSPRFSEFMMGLPAGWVTDTPGITRNEALRALGNGVVPQQAAAAVAFLLDVLNEQVAA